MHRVGVYTDQLLNEYSPKGYIGLAFDASRSVFHVKLAETVRSRLQIRCEPRLYGHYNVIRPPAPAGILAVDNMTARWQHVRVVARNNGKCAEFPIQ